MASMRIIHLETAARAGIMFACTARLSVVRAGNPTHRVDTVSPDATVAHTPKELYPCATD